MKIYTKIILIFLLMSFLSSKESIEITKAVDKKDSSIVNATAILYLDQNIDNIFERIIDFSNYHNNIKVIDKSEVYHQSHNLIKLKMTANILYIFDVVNHFTHKVDNKMYKITWELDDMKDNTLVHSKGGWKLEKLSDNTTKVVYHNSIKTPYFMPSIISDYIMEEGIKDSTTWLLKESLIED